MTGFRWSPGGGFGWSGPEECTDLGLQVGRVGLDAVLCLGRHLAALDLDHGSLGHSTAAQMPGVSFCANKAQQAGY